MPSIRYETGTLTTSLSTELNALANNAGALTTGAFDNSTAANGYFWADFEILVTYATAPAVNTLVELYLIPSLDGTNFADASAGTTPVLSMANYRGGFPLRAVTTAQRIILSSIVLPPQAFKVQIVNRAGLAMASTGNLVRFEPYRETLI